MTKHRGCNNKDTETSLKNVTLFVAITSVIMALSYLLPEGKWIQDFVDNEAIVKFFQNINKVTFDNQFVERLILSLSLSYVLYRSLKGPIFLIIEKFATAIHARPSSKIYCETIGRILYFVARKRRKIICKKHKLHIHTIVSDFSFVNLEHEELTFSDLIANNFIVITGPPGVGKSVYLASKINSLISNFDLAFSLTPSDISKAMQREKYSALWPSLMRSIKGLAYDEYRTAQNFADFDNSIIAFILGHRKVLITINDLHMIRRSAVDVLTWISHYFRKHHRWGPHISIVFTTREPEEKLHEDFYRDSKIIPLHPIEQIQAQHLFFKLSREASVPKEEILKEYKLLEKAFDSKSLRVPLFIVLCAYLVSPKQPRPLKISDVLKMTAVQLLDAFLEALYRRAPPPDEMGDYQVRTSVSADNYTNFKIVLACFAHRLWPLWDQFDEALLIEELRRAFFETKIQEPNFDIEFLAANGFLVRGQTTGTKMSFPHQSVVDYLAAIEMSRLNNFVKLQNYFNPLRVEGIRAILVDVVDSVKGLQQLFYYEPETAMEVFCTPRFQLPTYRPNFKVVGQNMARWAIAGAPHSVAPQLWSEAYAAFDQFDDKSWLPSLMWEIKDKAKPTTEGIIVLSRVGYSETQKIIEGWLTSADTENAFKRAVATSLEVREALDEIFRGTGINSDVGKTAFRIVWHRAKEIDISDNSKEEWKIFKYLSEISKGNKPGELGILAREFGHPLLRYIGYLAAENPLVVKRSLSEACAKELGHVLVCPGDYEVRSKTGKSEVVTIQKPIWVPCAVSEKHTRTFENNGSVRSAISAYESKLMYVDEVRVVLAHFQHLGLEHGGVMMFENGYEAFRTSVAKTDLYSVSFSTNKQIVSAIAPDSQMTEKITVAYRPIIRL